MSRAIPRSSTYVSSLLLAALHGWPAAFSIAAIVFCAAVPAFADGSLPSIVTQPVSQSVNLGQTATFTVAANGPGPLTYQWQKNNVPIPGATSASYTTPVTTIDDNGTTFRVGVANSSGGVASVTVTLTVLYTPVSITAQPTSQTVPLGQTATFTVSGAGTGPLIYQWRKNNISIAGANSATYTTPPITQTDDGAKYVVSVSNSFSGVTSVTVTLNVANASITTQPVSQTVAIGQTATFTVVGKGPALVYQWRKNNISMTGANSPSYTTPPVTQADDGTKYVVSVSNTLGGVTSNIVTLTVANPSIVTQPLNQLRALSEMATFSVTAKGAAPLAYQWSKNGALIAGAISASYTTPPLTQTDNGAKFAVSVSNAYGSVSSSSATLSIGNPLISTQPVSQTLAVGQMATFSVAGTGAAPLTYQWRKNNISISGATAASYTTGPVTQADDGTTYVVSVSNGYGGVTSNTVVLSIGNPTIATQPVSQSVAIGQTATFTVVGKGTALVYQWRKNNISIQGATAASYTTPPLTQADDGTKYVVSVSNSYSGVTSNIVTLSIANPSITTQPMSQLLPIGQMATLTVVAKGAGPLAYQWSRNNVPISGATSASYTTAPLTQADHNSTYAVTVSNSYGSASSNSAVLSIGNPSITQQPLSQTLALGQMATFSVAGTGAAPLTYQWRKNNISISGATAASYTAPPAVLADEGATYVVSISNTYGGVTSNIVTVNIGNPSITQQPVSQTVALGQTATFAVAGRGPGPLVYQWRKNNISISGANAPSYTTPPVTQADNGATYVVSVSNTYGGVTSNLVVLSLNDLSITRQPASQTTVLGNPVTFSVAGTGNGTLSYEWLQNGVPVSFGSSTYTFTPIEEDNGSSFVSVISDASGSIISQPATLTVLIPATIDTPPQSLTVAVGATASFSVVAESTYPLTYQWQRLGRGQSIAQDIPGATSASYVTPPVTSADQSSLYTVRVADSQGNSALASASLTVTPTSPATYYVDYQTGDDNNDGTVRSAPWRHAPGMNGCTGICLMTVMNPGDRVIFKGGAIWDSQAFPMLITRSGTQTAPIYFGVDQTWYVGSAWARPVFDLSGVVFSGSPVTASSANFIGFDNFEIRNAQLSLANAWPARGNITVDGGTGDTVQNCYIHGWSINNPGAFGPVAAGIAFVDEASNGAVSNCVIDGSPVEGAATAIYGGRVIQGNVIQNVTSGIVIVSDQEDVDISGNRIFRIGHTLDSTRVANGIEVWGPAEIYNNVIHDLFPTATAVSLQSISASVAFAQYVYNNLVWNIGTVAAMKITFYWGMAQNEFIYNNTIQAGATGCIQVVPEDAAAGNLTIENNHCMSDQTTLPAWCWNAAQSNSSCGSVSSPVFKGNVLMTTSTAAAQSYSIANGFQPSAPSSSTVGAGQDLSAQCSSPVLPLCRDRISVERLSGSAWDAGAYVYLATPPSATPLVTQDPASSIVAVGQTATFTVVATAMPAPSYQWQRNGIAILGATSSSYTTPPTSSADDGSQFLVVISNGSGAVASGVAILSVRNTPGLLVSSASTVAFGNVYVGITAPAQPTLTNNGQLDVSIINFSIAGAGVQVSGVPTGTILAPGQTATMLVTFSPSSVGVLSGSITVSSDASNSPLTVPITGNGIALASHGVILSWTPSISDDVVGYRIYRKTDPAASYIPLTATAQITTNVADLGVSAGQTYYYAVTAINADGVEGDYSQSVQATIPTP
jgi:hypothetical protein